jgi:hypothetical protein
MRSVLIPLTLGLGLVAGSSQAGDLQILGGVTLAFALGGDKGTRSDFNPHIEAEFSHVYAGVSADIYNGSVNDEISPYIGYRSSTGGGLSYDVSYSRTILPNDGGDCCGKIDAGVGLLIGNRLTASLDMGLVPETGDRAVHIGVDVAAFDKVTFTAKAGVAGSDNDWELAAGYQLTDSTEVTAHYYDGSAIKPYIGLDLTWNFGQSSF